MTRDQWMTKFAQHLIDRGGLDAGEAAAYAKECATLQVDQYGQNPAKWQSPTDAANEEMACWADDEGTCP